MAPPPETPSLRLDGRVAIVTGGGAGIGRGIALAFAQLGAHCVIADRDANAGEAVAAELSAIGPRALAVETDVRDPEACQALVSATGDAFQRVDILVNNAGGVRRAPFLELGPEGWRRHIDLNLVGMFAPTDAAVRAMMDGGRGGAVINVSSLEGIRSAPGYSVYAACKAGMLNFTKTLALELAEHRIRVNAIAPDLVETEAIREAMAEVPDAAARTAARLPLARAGTPSECGAVCAFLASDASSYLTGATIPVDGGSAAAGGWQRDLAGRWVL